MHQKHAINFILVNLIFDWKHPLHCSPTSGFSSHHHPNIIFFNHRGH